MSSNTPVKLDKFVLVKALAEKFSQGDLELPSFPGTLLRIRKRLADEYVTTEQIEQPLGADAELALSIFLFQIRQHLAELLIRSRTCGWPSIE